MFATQQQRQSDALRLKEGTKCPANCEEQVGEERPKTSK